MHEGITEVRCLMSVQLYELSENYIHDLREAQHNKDHIFSFLPKYTINTNKEQHNQLIDADYFLQFIGFEDHKVIQQKFLLFDLDTQDNLLGEEISQIGIDDMFKEVDFKKILSVFTPQGDDYMKTHAFPQVNYLIVEVIFNTSYDHFGGGYECESFHNIIGYLDHNLETQYFK